MVIVALAYVFPIYWALTMSLKRPVDSMAMPPKWLFVPTFKNYITVWAESDFLRYCFNSFAIAVMAMTIGLILAIPAAYIIARYRPKGDKVLLFAVLSTRIVPQITFIIPFFIFFRRLHLTDTYISVVIMHLTIILGFGIWMMRSFFLEIPLELEEAALIDGCTYSAAFRRVILPLTGPGIATTAIFSFNYSWNEFLYALVLTGLRTKTLPLGVYNWVGYEEIQWGELTATAILAIIPIVIFYSLLQKRLVSGLTMGALKG
jgi:multiple sugar transport system permease protein